jgi:flagellar biosynthesis/type III secretory pathway M-ring protein FliF/YscJ
VILICIECSTNVICLAISFGGIKSYCKLISNVTEEEEEEEGKKEEGEEGEEGEKEEEEEGKKEEGEEKGEKEEDMIELLLTPPLPNPNDGNFDNDFLTGVKRLKGDKEF